MELWYATTCQKSCNYDMFNERDDLFDKTVTIVFNSFDIPIEFSSRQCNASEVVRDFEA